MSIKPPFTDLEINRQASGFYKDNSLPIALLSKGIMVALVLWALIFPANANGTLGSFNSLLLEKFNVFYIIIVGSFIFFLLIIALLPKTGARVMGLPGEKPEFSNFSWFSMMFGAGLGVGLMVFATAEPLTLWGSNPVVVAGEVAVVPPVQFGVSVYEAALVNGDVRRKNVAEVAVGYHLADGGVYPERMRRGDYLSHEIGAFERRFEHLSRVGGVHRHSRLGQRVLARVERRQDQRLVHVGPSADANGVRVVSRYQLLPAVVYGGQPELVRHALAGRAAAIGDAGCSTGSSPDCHARGWKTGNVGATGFRRV